jgi:acyl-coenzyme A thioesterase PaaI-like protein
MDLDVVRVALPASVPMVATLELEFVELSYDRAVLRLPDLAPYRNHIGGPHVGAMFTLAESATGALILANFGDLLGEVTPLAVDSSIRCVKVALGPVTATATMSTTAAAVLATLQTGERPEFTLHVELTTGEGDERLVTGEASVLWTLRPQRR